MNLPVCCVTHPDGWLVQALSACSAEGCRYPGELGQRTTLRAYFGKDAKLDIDGTEVWCAGYYGHTVDRPPCDNYPVQVDFLFPTEWARRNPGPLVFAAQAILDYAYPPKAAE